MGFTRGCAVVLYLALAVAAGSSARAQLHTVRFLNPNAVPTGHLPDTGGVLIPTSHNFQEDGVHVEAIWAPSTHIGFTQGHFHHLEYGYETTHGFGDPDDEGWYDLQGFYLRMVDGRPFTLVSIDYRLRIDLQTTDILVATTLDPTLSFTGQFVHQPVGRFAGFRTLSFSGFEDLNEVFISSILTSPNRHQIQFDNIVVYTAPPVYGACCPAEGLGCNQQTIKDCTVDGGTYLGDNVPCTAGEFCPTRTGACCTPDASACSIKAPAACALADGAFVGLGSACNFQGACPLAVGKCCIENGADCLQVIQPACTGANTFFHGAGTQCVVGEECFVPCDIDEDCDDADPCDGGETCNVATGECFAGAILNCDDQDACTSDSCTPGLGCEHAAIGCNDSDPCTQDACEPTLGCTNTLIICTDGDLCNGIETCNPETGRCQIGSALDCDDDDACTSDSCDASDGCAHVGMECDDLNLCTVDSCDAIEGCLHEPVVCDDDNLCNGLETCNLESGLCDLGTPLQCDDQNACTFDECAPLLGCSHTIGDCDDSNPCTVDSCDEVLGCAHGAVVCDDDNVCNGLETCDAVSGVCDPGTPLLCDDQNACTNESCDPLLGCLATPVDCDDLNACTFDGCHVALGCKHDPIDCDDGDLCNGLETCDPQNGSCTPGSPLDCDDRDACTFDKCSATTGCQHIRFECDDDDSCTADSCDPVLGCAHTPVVCDDENVCNGVESCNPQTGACDAGATLDCDDGDACSVDTCHTVHGCRHAPMVCDDADVCTTDRCDSILGCTHTPFVCQDADVCNGSETCDAQSGACLPGTTLPCDDDDACTLDRCSPIIGCEHVSESCDDLDACTVDSCDPLSGCAHVAVVCDDQNLCNGLESCNPKTGECQPGTLLSCDDNDACTVDTCNAVKGCASAPIACDDQDSCTIDSCHAQLGCRVEPLCDAGYACSKGECSCIEPRGDRDGDGDRDPADLTYFLLCMDGPNDPTAPQCECQDANDDGHVDLLDLAEFLVP